ncbi:hypothetical protein [Pseudomonas poae]|uniref:hypothetical protein n=1 Tax=Pseudomonas poae TaxID=200451 RepID=UPI0034D3DAAD
MRNLYPFMLLVLTLNVQAAQTGVDLPSCDLTKQRALVVQIGGQVKDVKQAHISMRTNVLNADISTARKSRKITKNEASGMIERVSRVRKQTENLVAKQGVLSAADKADLDRELDSVANQLCR